MSSITATPDAANSWVRLEIDYSDTVADAVSVVRNNPDGSTTPVRLGSFTTALTQVPSNTSQTFEKPTLTGWSSTTGVTLAVSSARAHTGVSSMLLTPDGVTASPFALSDRFLVSPTGTVAFSPWLYAVNAYATGVRVGVNWYTGIAGSFISSTSIYPSGAVAIGAGTWTQFGSAITGIYPQAPAGTGAAAVSINYAGTPGATITLNVDDARAFVYPLPAPLPVAAYGALVAGKLTLYDTEMPLDANVSYTATAYTDQGPITSGTQTYDLGVPVGAAVTSSTVQVGSNGWLWLKDPLNPAASIPISTSGPSIPLATKGPGVSAPSWPPATLQGLDANKRAVNSTVFNVNNQALPIPVSKTRAGRGSQLFLITRTFADRDRLDSLLSPGSPLLLQSPAPLGLPDRYWTMGDTQESRVGQDHRYAPRVFALPMVEVPAPAGASSGVPGARWSDLCNHVTTWGAQDSKGGGTYDLFGRTAVSSLGTSDGGLAWTAAGTVADYSVSPGMGQVAVSAVNVTDRGVIGFLADSEQWIDVQVPVIALGSAMQFCLLARSVDASNYYRLGLQFNAGASTNLVIIKRVAGTETTVSVTSAPGYSVGQWWRIHASVIGTSLSINAWPRDTAVEATTYVLTGSDAALSGATSAGFFVRLSAGNTNTLPVTFGFDNYRLITPSVPTWTQTLARVNA